MRKTFARVHFQGNDVDPSCLYSPKPSTNSLVANNDNIPSTPTNALSSRSTAQSLRGIPSNHQTSLTSTNSGPSMPATLKATRSQIDNRKSESSFDVNVMA
jgi:hypothetical protein